MREHTQCPPILTFAGPHETAPGTHTRTSTPSTDAVAKVSATTRPAVATGPRMI